MKSKKEVLKNLKTIVLLKNNSHRRVLLSNSGFVCKGGISEEKIQKILCNLKYCIDNIPESWMIEGYLKNEDFFLKYIYNEKKEIIDVDETIEWSKIWGVCMTPIFYRGPKDLAREEMLKTYDVRNISKIPQSDIENMVYDLRWVSWSDRIDDIEFVSEGENE